MANKSRSKRISPNKRNAVATGRDPDLDERIGKLDQLPRLDTEMLQLLIKGIFSTHPDELTCDECHEKVGRFGEMVLEGKNAAEALPLVQDHLDRCQCCREEFEMLLDALRAIAE